MEDEESAQRSRPPHNDILPRVYELYLARGVTVDDWLDAELESMARRRHLSRRSWERDHMAYRAAQRGPIGLSRQERPAR